MMTNAEMLTRREASKISGVGMKLRNPAAEVNSFRWILEVFHSAALKGTEPD
jgi:hypothetical protein